MSRRATLAVTLLAALLLALATAGSAAAAEPRFTMDEISRELMCPQCGTRLDLSTGPAAERIRVFVADRRGRGWTKQQVKDAVVAEFGTRALAAPPRSGFGGLAWLVPTLAALGGIVAAVVALRVWRRRPAAPGPGGGVEPDDQAWAGRVDDALARFDR
jgi:cytochrome c-type biogenesis protein CcmH/NrfF